MSLFRGERIVAPIITGAQMLPSAGSAPSVAVLTDSTGGTPSTTFAAIAAGTTYLQADIVAAKNALSQTAASLNAIIAALKGAGITV